MGTEREFVDGVLRVNERYLVEVVEAFGLCPFARATRLGGGLDRRVMLQVGEEMEPALEALGQMEGAAKTVIGLLIFPRFGGGVDDFERFVGELRRADEARTHGKAPFAMAMFHPDVAFGVESPRRMVTLFRRAPDPTIQLVRFSVLDAAKGAASGKFLFDYSAAALAELARRAETVPLSERIAADNFATLQSAGIAQFIALLDDLRLDRSRLTL